MQATSTSAPAMTSNEDRIYCTDEKCERKGVNNSKSTFHQHIFNRHLTPREQYLLGAAFCTHCQTEFADNHAAFAHYLMYRHKIDKRPGWNGDYSEEYHAAYEKYRRLKMEMTRFSTEDPHPPSAIQAPPEPVQEELKEDDEVIILETPREVDDSPDVISMGSVQLHHEKRSSRQSRNRFRSRSRSPMRRSATPYYENRRGRKNNQ